MLYITLSILASVLLILGVVMSIIPGIPNLIFMLVVAILFGFYDGFVHLTSTNIMFLVIISALAMFVDFISGIAGAKYGGAHWSSIISGLIGLIIGSSFIPIPVFGSLAGMFLGILFSEWYRMSDLKHANRAAVGSFIGSVFGTVVRAVVSIIFLVLFIVFILN